MVWGRARVGLGDRFTKVSSDPSTIWVVDRLIDQDGMPQHAELIRADDGSGSMIVSTWTLKNNKYFRSASDAQQS